MNHSTAVILKLRVMLLAMTTLVAVGCGGGETIPMGTAKGSVTVDDKPYNSAQLIFFSPKSGAASEALIKDDGTYELGNPVPAGDYVVYLAPKPVTISGSDMGAVKIDTSVNEKYWNETTSDVKVTIKEGQNDIPVKFTK